MYVIACIAAWPITRWRLGYPMAWRDTLAEASPWNGSAVAYLAKAFVVTIFADWWTYTKHRVLHNRYLFAFHKMHHAYHDPTVFAGFAVHPFEGILTFGPIWMFSYPGLNLYLPLHLPILLFFALLNFYLHCGYSVPLLEKWLPRLFINTSEWHNTHHAKTVTHFGEMLIIWDLLCGTHTRVKQTLTENEMVSSVGRTLRRTIFVADVICRWFDIEYQAITYRLLYSRRATPLHLVSFGVFILTVFTASAASSPLKNALLLVVATTMTGSLYAHRGLARAVVLSTVAFWAAGHVVVWWAGPALVRSMYPLVVVLSVALILAGALEDDAIPFIQFAPAGADDKFQSWPEWIKNNHWKTLPFFLMVPFALLQAFLAPFRLFPVCLYLLFFAEQSKVDGVVSACREQGMSRAKMFAHLWTTDPFRIVSSHVTRITGLSFVGQLLSQPAAVASLAIVSFSIPLAFQVWLLT